MGETTTVLTEKEKQQAKAEADAKVENAKRSGKGTRVSVGATRGKGTQVISFEEFDEEQPETLPSTYAEFAEITKIADEKEIVSLLITGFNARSYKEASDPIAEYVESAWSKDVQTSFRASVRAYAKATSTSIEEAVSIIKPGVEKAVAKSKG